MYIYNIISFCRSQNSSFSLYCRRDVFCIFFIHFIRSFKFICMRKLCVYKVLSVISIFPLIFIFFIFVRINAECFLLYLFCSILWFFFIFLQNAMINFNWTRTIWTNKNCLMMQIIQDDAICFVLSHKCIEIQIKIRLNEFSVRQGLYNKSSWM